MILNESWPVEPSRLVRLQVSKTASEDKFVKMANISKFFNKPVDKEEYFKNIQEEHKKIVLNTPPPPIETVVEVSKHQSILTYIQRLGKVNKKQESGCLDIKKMISNMKPSKEHSSKYINLMNVS